MWKKIEKKVENKAKVILSLKSSSSINMPKKSPIKLDVRKNMFVWNMYQTSISKGFQIKTCVPSLNNFPNVKLKHRYFQKQNFSSPIDIIVNIVVVFINT
jgi:hypothetical protein